MRILTPFTVFLSLALLAAACGAPDRHEPPPIAEIRDARSAALFLVPDDTQLTAAEVALQDRLSQSGYEVHLATEIAGWIEEDQHVELIIIAPGADRSGCKRLAESNSPLLVMDAECMEALEMARLPEGEASEGETGLRLLGNHPLTAGLLGDVRVASAPSPRLSPTLGTGALLVASRSDETEASAIFAYERDAATMKLPATARRVGWLAGSAQNFTVDGWLLFDAAVRWAAQPAALLLVDGEGPTAGEARMLARLQDPLGFQTEVRQVSEDHDALLDRARRARLVILSHSASAGPLASALRTLRVPVLTMEPSVLESLGMLAEGEEQRWGALDAQPTIDLHASNHLLGAASAESVTLTSSPQSMHWATAGDSAIVIASITGAPERASLFAFDGLDAGDDSPIIARRFAFLVGSDSVAEFTPEAWRLFDLAVRWSARIYDLQSPCMGRPDGASCADDDACNGAESCQAERCVPGPVDSDDPRLDFCELGDSPEIQLGNSPIELLAIHECQPGSDPVFEGAETERNTPVAFQLPPSLAVRLGNAGNALAQLRYLSSDGDIVVCQYRGASTLAHPTADLDVAAGRQYRFESCTNGAVPGTNLQSTWFALDLEGSDCQPAPWKTEVEVHLGAGGCSAQLADPISAVDSIITRDSFSWSDTQPVNEYDAQGRPSLYHALIYIESREQRGFLDELLIHHSLMPIFNSDRRRYAGQCGSFEFEGDGQGLFVYAIVPGVTYNLLRQYALTPSQVKGDQAVFRVVKLARPQDPGATNLDGSLSYEALGASGFRYMDLEELPASGSQALFVSGLIRSVVNAVAETVRGTVREVLTGLGEIVIFVGVDSAPFYVELDVLNRDPLFDPQQTLISGWNGGNEITLPGVRIEVNQRIGSVLPVKFYSFTDGDGRLNGLRVAKGRGIQSICVAVQNKAAEVTSYVTETMVCGFASSGYAGAGQVEIKDSRGSDPFVPVVRSITPGDVTFLKMKSQNKYLHLLALLTDSYEYTKSVVGRTPDTIDVLKGPLANTLGAFGGNAAFVPCFGHSTAALDTSIALLATAVGAGVAIFAGPAVGASVSAAVAAFLFGASSAIAVDMILPASDAADSFSSRGIAVHEYGHVVFCDLLHQADEGSLYTDMMLSRITSGKAGAADAHLAYVNEAFADFFIGQVAGAANYFIPSAKNVEQEDSLYWCIDDTEVTSDPTTACFDNNHSDRSSFSTQVGRLASTLHDAFDGNHLGYRVDRPNDATMWKKNSSGHLVYTSDTSAHSFDEAVAMKGECIYTVVEKYARRGGSMRGDLRFLAGLSDAMQEPTCSEFQPPTWCDRCVLFANHDDALLPQASLQEKYQECASGELAALVGAPPVADVQTLAAQCQACPVNYRSPDGVTCVFDPPIDCPASAPIAVYDGIEQQWYCQADCIPGFVLIDGECFSDAIID